VWGRNRVRGEVPGVVSENEGEMTIGGRTSFELHHLVSDSS
jgi:hypothetical protein